MPDTPVALPVPLAELVAVRHDIHAHPEMGLEERRTAALVAARLRAAGIEVVEGVGVTGVVGTIRGRRPGNRAIGLRADMDCLRIAETTGLPYASTCAGQMHACGHDGHTTILLGTALALAAEPDFAGTVHVIFQPAEEGRHGARHMVEDGLFTRFPCDAVYGLHNMPGFPVGTLATRPGPFMAAASQWTIRLAGKGGHGGANPHTTADLSVVAAHIVLGLQEIVGRNVPPLEPAVISVGHIATGEAESPNVLPAALLMRGTARAFSDEIAALIESRMAALATAEATLRGATAECEVQWFCPATVNRDPRCFETAVAAARAVPGMTVDPAAPMVTGGEDFAVFLHERPGAFVFLGNGQVGGKGGAPIHTPAYDFNDEAIPYGIAWFRQVVRRELA